MQIEIDTPLQPGGIFRARPTGSSCINSSADLSLEATASIIFIPFSRWLFNLLQQFPHGEDLLGTSLRTRRAKRRLAFLCLRRPWGSLLAWLLFECENQVMSRKRRAVPPNPYLSQELNHPAHDPPLYLCQSFWRGKWQWQPSKSHNDSCMVIHLPSHCDAPTPLVILSQPRVTRTCQMVQHLVPRFRGGGVRSFWDRHLICRSNTKAGVGLPIVSRWSSI